MQFAATNQLKNELVSQVWIDRGGAVTDQAGEVMRIAQSCGFDDNVGVTAQSRVDQRVVYAAGGKYRRDRQPALGNGAVGQHDHHVTITHCLHGFLRERLQRLAQRGCGGVVIQIESHAAIAFLIQRSELEKLVAAQQRRINFEAGGVLWCFLKQVALAPEAGVERHHNRFADRVNRRVGDLRELLAQIIVGRAHLLRQHRHRGVVAHRADRLLAVFCEHTHDLVTLFEGDLKHFLVGQ